MNTARLLIAVLATAAGSHAAPVSKLAAEWQVPSEIANDRFTLVDAASGTVRSASMSANGVVTWLHTVPTGITGVSDIASGLTGAFGEMLAITSPLANRVALVELDAATPTARVLPTLTGVGPSALSELRVGTSTELLINSIHNGGTNYAKTEVRHDLGTSAPLLAQTNYSLNFRRAQPLVDPSSGNRVAFYTATGSGTTTTGLLFRSGSSLFRYAKLTFNGILEFLPGVLDINGPAGNPLILGYSSGATTGRIVLVRTPIATTSFTSASITYPFAIAGVVPIPAGGVGNLTDGFLAIAANGSQARWMRINATADGLIDTGVNFTPTPGSALTGLIPLPGAGLIKLGGPAVGQPSASFTAFQWNGSAWTETDSGNLPEIPAVGRSVATLLYYDQNPAASSSARLLGMENAPDWTRRNFSPDPVPASVLKESFVSSAGGLSLATPHPLSPPFGTGHVITNQVEPALSIAALGSAAALFTPDLRVEPASGTYDASFQITALFDAERHELLWRDENGGTWQTWKGPLAVAYPRSLQFSLRSKATATRGPIERRAYRFLPEILASQDSDNDGVPDYVELHFGLDPFGGPDHDGDGKSDLFEILQGTNPANANSFPASESGIAINGGFRLVANAKDHSTRDIRTGEEISARALDGTLLARQPSTTISPVLPDGSNRGAILSSTTTVPFNELLALSTPLYFTVTGGMRTGRELIGFVPADPPPPFAPDFTPGGTNFASDAAGWVAAAISAAANRPLAESRTEIHPADTAVSVLLEEFVHRGLNSAPPVPANFTLFPSRDSDRTRSPLLPADIDRLKAFGFDFRLALALATSARSGMSSCANSIYARHATNSATTPGMLMPLDALRIILRGGGFPTSYVGSVTTTHLNNARNAYATALANSGQAIRTTAVWTVEIPETSLGRGVYQRQPENVPVVLLTAGGDRFRLEQGLGLRPGTRFQVSGFTDTPAAGAYASMEINAAMLTFQPVSSDNDADGNLLDDEWERFFFGATGQDPLSRPGSSAHSLLQYFLEGLDPRGDASPSTAALTLAPQLPILTPAGGGTLTLDFLFPAAFQNRFDFILEKSTTLAPGSFVEIPDTGIATLGGDELRATIPASAAATPRGFYRIRLALR